MIEISELSKNFNSHKVLDELSLKINTGETCVIIGRSGCGKSVLLKHIVGILKPDGGKIFIDGKEVINLNEGGLKELRMKIGLVFHLQPMSRLCRKLFVIPRLRSHWNFGEAKTGGMPFFG